MTWFHLCPFRSINQASIISLTLMQIGHIQAPYQTATDICHKTARKSDSYPLLLILSRCMWQFDWWGVYASIELLESAWQAKEKADMSWLNKLLCSYIGCWTPWAIRELWLDKCIKDKLQWVKSFNDSAMPVTARYFTLFVTCHTRLQLLW